MTSSHFLVIHHLKQLSYPNSVMLTTISTYPKTLFAHRLLLVLSPIAILIFLFAFGSMFRGDGSIFCFYGSMILLIIPVGLLAFQYFHQAYLALVCRAVFPAIFLSLNTLLFASYSFLSAGYSFDVLSFDALLSIHPIVLLGYFVHHNASPLEENTISTSGPIT